METMSSQEALRTEAVGRLGLRGKQRNYSQGQRKRGPGQQEVFGGGKEEVQQLSFLRQGHMSLVIPLVTCEMVGDRRGRKTGKQRGTLAEISGLSCLSPRAPTEEHLSPTHTPLTVQSFATVRTLPCNSDP